MLTRVWPWLRKSRWAGTSPARTGYLTEKQIIRQMKPDSHSEADWPRWRRWQGEA